jgi:hypothetical protein
MQRCRGRLPRVVREDDHQAISLTDRIGADSARRPDGPLAQIRNLRDAAVSAVGPRVIAAPHDLVLDNAHAQRYLAVGTSILARIDRPALPAVKRDPLTRECRGGRCPRPQPPGLRDRVPENRIDSDPAKIWECRRMSIIQVILVTHSLGRHSPVRRRQCLGHGLLPRAQRTLALP